MTPPAATGPLIDGFGRVHTDLRISITDRCNFRCTYCMPTEGMQWLPRPELLTYEEIERIARVAVTELGITSIRITGGEPTVRSHLPVLVAKLARLGVDVALTTNGATLASQAADLAAAGLHRVNISLDTLQPDRFAAITRRDDLERVLAGVDAAVAAGLQPVKLNAVIVRGVNDDEIEALAAYGREVGAEVRFIEFMPLDGDGTWDVEAVVPAAEIVARLDAAFGLAPAEARGHEPAAGLDAPAASRAATTPTAGAPSASSPASRTRSATGATGSASPPKGGCGRACSRSTRSISAGSCATTLQMRRRRMRRSPPPSAAPSPTSGPATTSPSRCSSVRADR